MANPIPNLFKVPELKEKILFTLMVLLIYRFGAHITVPGVDMVRLQAAFATNDLGSGLLGVYDMFTGGALSRATVLALGIMPYISASIMFQLLAAVVPKIEKMQKEGEEGRKKLTQWTRYVTIVLALVQGYGYAIFLQTLNAQAGGVTIVASTGFAFLTTTALILTVGAVFVMWLGEQITERGIGNGMSLLIFFSIIQGFPGAVKTTWDMVSTGVISPIAVIILMIVMVAVVAGVVAMTMAARKIPVQIPRKVMGRGRVREGQKSFIPLRINSAGVMPIIFAQSIIVIPGTLAQFMGGSSTFMRRMSDAMQPGTMLYMVLYAALIFFFTYFYTAIIFNPVDLAENLKKQGGFIPGVKPGAKTAEYIDYVLSRVTIAGALYLAAIALLPFLVFDMFGINNQFGGTSLLIVVGVALDTVQQMQQHMLLRHYEGFMKKGRVRFRGRQRFG